MYAEFSGNQLFISWTGLLYGLDSVLLNGFVSGFIPLSF